jgi:glutamyl-Q tRNA(Asp) synthetase
MTRYVGRFAPSPTGALHAGSLVAALASWLDARAHAGTWLVRIEDVDAPRCIPGAAQEILRQLAACGLNPDEEPVYQSQRSALYQAALNRLILAQLAYPCACSRKDIEEALAVLGKDKPRHGELIYPGTCREGLAGRPERAWRFDTRFYKQKQPLAHMEYSQSAMKSEALSASGERGDEVAVRWQDRRLGSQQHNVTREVGDFVLRRADGLWAYQLAMVVDDADQGITHVVRGEDLADNTARQILLQRALDCTTPQYLHTPLVFAADGHKLSKQNGAKPLELGDERQVCSALDRAAAVLGLQRDHASQARLSELLQTYVTQWQGRPSMG